TRKTLFHVNALGSSSVDVVVRRNKFSNDNTAALTFPSDVFVEGDATAGVATTLSYDVSCNTLRDAKGIALSVSKGVGNGTWSGSIVNNTIGVSGVTG